MRAARLVKALKVITVEAEKPVIKKPDDVLIRVKVAGVCGSENHAFKGTHPFRKPPVIMGHEMSGVVEEIGQAVEGFSPGDRVFVDPQLVCGKCEYCLMGDHHMCPSKVVLGSPTWEGAFGEFVVVPSSTVIKLPDKMSFAQGAMIEPLSVSYHAVKRTGIKKGETIAILGTGTIGGLACAAARVQGAGKIICVDQHQHCLDAARESLGATHDFLLPDPDFVQKILKETDGKGVDAVLVSGDDNALVKYALEIVKRRKTVVVVALLTDAPIQFSAHTLVREEINFIGTYMYNKDDIYASMKLIESGLVDVDAIVTHKLPIDQAQKGMEMAISKENNAIKVLLTHSMEE